MLILSYSVLILLLIFFIHVIFIKTFVIKKQCDLIDKQTEYVEDLWKLICDLDKYLPEENSVDSLKIKIKEMLDKKIKFNIL